MPIDPIYVTGHRNPDTDSVVAAMAYTALRHALGDREYEAACLGRVSDETRRVLDRFGFQPPVLITGMHTQVREQVLKHRQRCYPILDENEKVAGVLTRYHLLRPRRKRVVLVDHNEVAQSVPGLEEAEILEIIDHHRLARMAGVSPEDLGRDVFSVPVEGKTAEELLFTDYKEFRIAGQELAVSQITCADCGPLLERKEEFLALMKKTAAERKFDLVALMLTDVLRSGTRLLFVGDGDTVRQAFHVQPRDNEVFLPGILSRKKQVIPMLSALWG